MSAISFRASIRFMPCIALAGLFSAPSLPSAQQQQQPPPVPVELLRARGVEGFRVLPPASAEMMTRRHGALRSGWALPIDPGQTIEFSLRNPAGQAEDFWTPERTGGGVLQWVETVEWSIDGGVLSRSSTGDFKLRLPGRPGVFPFKVTVTSDVREDKGLLIAPRGLTSDVSFLLKAPYERQGNGMIGDYPMGIYPNETGRNAPSIVARYPELYQPPKSFFLVTPEVEELKISAHFTVGDFSPRVERGKPHYISIDPRLIEILEAAHARMAAKHGPVPEGSAALVVLTGFLSPNHLLQLRQQGVSFADFTRYQYGDGAAVIWDVNGDGMMDDLNDDGQIGVEDARILADEFVDLQKQMGKFGGGGVSDRPKMPGLPETPLVDVDMRGVASWY